MDDVLLNVKSVLYQCIFLHGYQCLLTLLVFAFVVICYILCNIYIHKAFPIIIRQMKQPSV
jgi:hypothetical protein